jgi:hypothetical protein
MGFLFIKPFITKLVERALLEAIVLSDDEYNSLDKKDSEIDEILPQWYKPRPC